MGRRISPLIGIGAAGRARRRAAPCSAETSRCVRVSAACAVVTSARTASSSSRDAGGGGGGGGGSGGGGARGSEDPGWGARKKTGRKTDAAFRRHCPTRQTVT